MGLLGLFSVFVKCCVCVNLSVHIARCICVRGSVSGKGRNKEDWRRVRCILPADSRELDVSDQFRPQFHPGSRRPDLGQI